MPDIPLTLDEWLPLALGVLRAIVFSYRQRPFKTPRTLDETYLEAVYELVRWYEMWKEEGRLQPKWTPATSATFAWQHALERIHAIMGGVMRTPYRLPRYGPERLRYQTTTPPEEMPYSEAFRSPEEDVAYKMAERAELREALSEVLNEIPAANADAIIMRYFQNMNLTEIGQRMGVTRPTVSNRIRRGIAMIQEMVGSDVTLLLHEFGNDPGGRSNLK